MPYMANALRISKEELEYHAKAFLENCSLTGKLSMITNPSSVEIKEYTTSEKYSYEGSETYDVPIHLDSDISKKKLESLGWLKEGDKSKPLVAFIPMYRYANPQANDSDKGLSKWSEVRFSIKEGAIVHLIGYVDDPLSEVDTSDFTVESVEYRDDMHYYMCQLAPKRDLTEGLTDEESPESGSKFLMQSDDHKR